MIIGPVPRLAVRENDQGHAVFDAPLAKNETVMIEYSYQRPETGPRPDNDILLYQFRQSVRALALEIRFAPGAVPAQAYQVTQQAGAPRERRRALHVSTSGSVHIAAQDVAPGSAVGIRWTGSRPG